MHQYHEGKISGGSIALVTSCETGIFLINQRQDFQWRCHGYCNDVLPLLWCNKRSAQRPLFPTASDDARHHVITNTEYHR